MNELAKTVNQTVDELDFDFTNLKNEFLEIPRAVKRIGWGALIPAICLLGLIVLVTLVLWK